jgi:hypothetical protein
MRHHFKRLARLQYITPSACRLDYRKNANLFVDDVKEEHDRAERKKFKAALEENRNKSPGGSNLGLW